MVGICFTHFTECNCPPIYLCSTLQTANSRKSKQLRATFFDFFWFTILRNRCKYLFINNYPCFLESLIFCFQIPNERSAGKELRFCHFKEKMACGCLPCVPLHSTLGLKVQKNLARGDAYALPRVHNLLEYSPRKGNSVLFFFDFCSVFSLLRLVMVLPKNFSVW